MAEPIIVVGAGFVPITGIAGVYGNNTVPPQQEEGAPVLSTQNTPNVPVFLQEQDVPPSITPVLEEDQPSPTPSSASSGE